MAMQTFPYRVRAGQLLPHQGEVFEAGAVVSLPRAVAAEVRHLVEPLDAAGNVIDPPSALQIALEQRPAHEHEGILQRRRAELEAHLVDLRDVADRTKATADAAAAEVAGLARAIAAIDAQLAAPAVPPQPAPAAPLRVPTTKLSPAVPAESKTSPEAPAQKE